MVSIKGMIIRCSSIIPELKEAIFRCLVCGFYSEPVLVDRGIQNASCDILKFKIHHDCFFVEWHVSQLQYYVDFCWIVREDQRADKVSQRGM